MAEPTTLVDDTLWERIAPLLPPQPPRPQGGRPRLSDRVALNGILFVLKTGIPWERLPQQMGYGSGMTCWRRLRMWQQAGIWPALQQVLSEALADAGSIDWNRAYAAPAQFPADEAHIATARRHKRQGAQDDDRPQA